MADKLYELDGLTARLIADRLVCPYIQDCRFYRNCNSPDRNALYYATHFCGDRFMQCQIYEAKNSRTKESQTDRSRNPFGNGNSGLT